MMVTGLCNTSGIWIQVCTSEKGRDNELHLNKARGKIFLPSSAMKEWFSLENTRKFFKVHLCVHVCCGGRVGRDNQ